jgi:phosphate transport system substrate-binding protein
MKNHLKAIIALTISAYSLNAADVDASIKPYKSGAAVSGNLSSIGSDTLNNLMTFWSEAFKQKHNGVNIQVEGKGSSTAPPALASGTSQLAPMSREMKTEEIASFEKKFGYKPTAIQVAVDGLAVFVHRDNPIKGLTMPQVDAIFSNTRKKGYLLEINDWADLGIAEWKKQKISMYGRNSASGTYSFFKEVALGKGDFSTNVKEQPGSSGVVQSIAGDPYGIGYSGVGYITSGVKALPLAENEGEPFIEPTYANCKNGDYPIARYLYVYINKSPNAPLDPLVKEFILFVLSKEGQQIVVKDGYYPLPGEVYSKMMTTLK